MWRPTVLPIKTADVRLDFYEVLVLFYPWVVIYIWENLIIYVLFEAQVA